MDDREYELKKADLALKEREVAAKEKESHVTWWKNPLVVGLIGAALALGGNIATNILSNGASAEAEHFRAQSNLVLSVIKTNGNEDDACKNLNFFVNIGWLDDPNGTIHNVCGKKGKDGVPTLPVASDPIGAVGGAMTGLFSPALAVITLNVIVEDADSHEPIANATVTQVTGSTSRSVVTDAKGNAILNFVSSNDSVTVSKDGYMPKTESLTHSGLTSLALPSITVDLHRAPKSKH